MARQREVPRQLRKLVSYAREWYEWNTAVHEITQWCTRLRSGAAMVHKKFQRPGSGKCHDS